MRLIRTDRPFPTSAPARRDRLPLLALASLATAVATPASAADYVVAPDGDDGNPGTVDQPLATIAHAVSLAGNGDAVRIRAGTYRLTDESPDAIHVTVNDSTESSFLTIEAYDGEEVVLLGSVSTEGQTWESVDGTRWRLSAQFLSKDPKGLFNPSRRIEHVMKDVSGTRSHADTTDLANPGEWTKADDAGIGCGNDNAACFIYLYPFDGDDPNAQTYELSQRKLFYSTGVSYLTVRGLTLYYTQDAAFSIEGGRGQVIEDNVLGHNSNGNDNAYSIFVSYGGGVTIRNNVAFDSKYWGGFSNSKGLTLMDMAPDDPALIEGNEVYDIVGQGITTKSGVANAIVQRNYVHDVGVGIEPPGPRCHWTAPDCVLGDPEYYPGGGWEIRENALVRCGNGVSMGTLAETEGGIGNRIYNNVFYDNETSGIDLKLRNTGTLIANNIFLDNPRGIFLNHGGSGDPIAIDAFMPVYTSHHNLFFGNDDDYLFRPDWTGPGGSGTGYTVDEIRSAYSQEEGSLAADPQVVDPAAPDFHLQDGSPARAAGDGSLYDATTVDMGMYPFGHGGGAGGAGGAGGSAGTGGEAGAPASVDAGAEEGGCGCRVALPD
ncbi:MAG: right-handed parallel beta-helix repeat-containing protein, partial [Deltaproteobacteria bacterium]|nr:right-handed parallel beta-helix repeat-containing protein [Deltaproteobacteria bacterium]MBW2530646.1 right-handed parallel beta-helix repeat-containing protein [Deltaproteobacteria bacterium]